METNQDILNSLFERYCMATEEVASFKTLQDFYVQQLTKIQKPVNQYNDMAAVTDSTDITEYLINALESEKEQVERSLFRSLFILIFF